MPAAGRCLRPSAASLLTGSLIHGGGWLAVAALVVVAGISAALTAVSSTGAVTGTNGLLR